MGLARELAKRQGDLISQATPDAAMMSRQPYIPHHLLLERALNDKQKKLGGTHGDSAALNWFLAIAIAVGSIVTIVFASNFLNAFARARRRDLLDYNTQYRVSQYVLGLAILTLVFKTVYILWVFMDARHPMRRAWTYSVEYADNQLPLKQDGTEWPWPGTGTMRFDRLNRLTTSRLFAARKHIVKLLVVQVFFLVAWLVPAILMAFKNGYVTSQHAQQARGTSITQVCGIERSRSLCMLLARTGIAAGAVTILFTIAVVASSVAFFAKKTIPAN